MIRVENLSKEYDEVVAVRDLTVDIPEGEIYGLIGPNGAGKTTTLRMCCGLLDPTIGRVTVNNIDVHSDVEQAQSQIGYLADFFSVYDELKVWEYLDYFARAYKLDPAKIPARVDEVIDEIGLETKRDSMVKGLSRGMKQRLGIGRAVIHRPKVLLLDEPASGLDPKARIELRQLLKRLRDNGATIVVSSHILPDLEDFSTSIGVMERGVMLRSGRVRDLRQEVEGEDARTIQISWLGPINLVHDFLQAHGLLQHALLQTSDGAFPFQGDDAALSALLAEMTTAGIKLTRFHEVKQTVEDLYLKLSHGQVM
jgi:ABC-2 type transport system ATP-binding protein